MQLAPHLMYVFPILNEQYPKNKERFPKNNEQNLMSTIPNFNLHYNFFKTQNQFSLTKLLIGSDIFQML
jgi:hypothetical protein